MRTTVNIDKHLLAEVKVIAARSHRSMGSVMEEALRAFLDAQQHRPGAERYELPTFTPSKPGLQPGVDLEDRDQIAELMGENTANLV